jgi:hypothetical protein
MRKMREPLKQSHQKKKSVNKTQQMDMDKTQRQTAYCTATILYSSCVATILAKHTPNNTQEKCLFFAHTATNTEQHHESLLCTLCPDEKSDTYITTIHHRQQRNR